MTDLEFMDQAEALLGRIEASCDRINDQTDADIDKLNAMDLRFLVDLRDLSERDEQGDDEPQHQQHCR